MDFEAVVYRFVDEHKEMNLIEYNRILEKANIAWGSEDMYSRNISDLDGQTVMALILCAIRAERFCTGALYGALENGIILKWLDRLHQLDEVGKA